MILTPGVLILIVPLQVTGWIEPGRFTGTGKLRRERNVLPFIPDVLQTFVTLPQAQRLIVLAPGDQRVDHRDVLARRLFAADL